MTDKEFLQWIYERLVYVHKTNPNLDYMHRLKKIIETTEDIQHPNNKTGDQNGNQ